MSVCRSWWIGAQKESDSDTKNPYKIRSFKVAAAAIENLNFKVQDADELRNVRSTPPILPFTKSVAEFVSAQ